MNLTFYHFLPFLHLKIKAFLFESKVSFFVSSFACEGDGMYTCDLQVIDNIYSKPYVLE